MKLSARWVCLVGAHLGVALSGCRTTPRAQAPASAPAPALARKATTIGPSSSTEVAGIRHLLDEGKALLRAGKPEQAEMSLQMSVQSASALSSDNPSLLSETLAELASCLVVGKHPAEARPLVERALPLVPRGTHEGTYREFQLQMILAESYRYEKRAEFAIAPFRAALAVVRRPEFEADFVGQHTDASTRLAKTLQELDRYPEAAETLDRALQVTRKNGQTADSRRLAVQLAFIQMRLGKLEEALALLKTIGAQGRRLQRSGMKFSDVSIEEFMAKPPSSKSNAPAAPAAPAVKPAPPLTQTPAASTAALRVAEMREGFQHCYAAALAADQQVEGSSRIVINVGADGTVVEARALGVGLPVDMVDCMLRRAVAGLFDPPDGGSAVIVVPITFLKQK